MSDDADVPGYIAAGRLRKAMDLEELALAAGVKAYELGPPGRPEAERIRRALLDALLQQRKAAGCTHGARALAPPGQAWCNACERRRRTLNASEETWRLVYKLLADRQRNRPAM